jgi:ribosome-binding factor A
MTNPSRSALSTPSPLPPDYRVLSSAGFSETGRAPLDDVGSPIGRKRGRPARAAWSEEFSMSSRRTAKVAEAVREEVSTTILFGLKDPRVKNVTVTRVEVSPDLRNAKVYVSVMGDETTQRLSLRGLESARGFLQAKLAERVQIRYTPILHFQLDQGVKKSIEASRLLREVLPPPSESEDETLADEASSDENSSRADVENEEHNQDQNEPPTESTLGTDDEKDRSRAEPRP